VVYPDGTPAPNPNPGPYMYDLGELVEQWLEKGEPVSRCVRCGWTALLGDWKTPNPPALVGAPTVTFDGWPELSEGFIESLFDRLGGGRCRYLLSVL
jgi:hypothetical protein